ncbi:MAG: AAA family ATPase [Clostridia bacterium]|nr:AAA family ATPase [Clostridia bacterium]
MRLLRAYIEGFGAIRNKSIDFDAGVTSVCEANGFGKSTTVAFLTAMFFGLEKSTKGKALTKREHFYPGSGAFGGYIEFEFGGDRYKIERYFGAKSSGDSVLVTRNGVASQEQNFLGISEEASFLRTLSINSSDIDITPTDEILTYLSGVVEGEESGDKTAAAVKILTERKRDETNAKTRAENEAFRLDGKIREKESLLKSVPGKDENVKALEEQLSELKARHEELIKAVTEKNAHKDFDALVEKKNTAEREIAFLEEKFSCGVPTEKELDDVRAAIIRDAAVTAGSPALTLEDRSRFAKLQREFAEGLPSEEDRAGISQKISELRKTDADLHAAQNIHHSEKDTRLLQKFGTRTPAADFSKKLDEAVSECRRADRSLNVERGAGAPPPDAKGPGKKKSGASLYIALIIIAAVILITGVVLAVVVDTVTGIIVSGVGLVLLIIMLVVYINSRTYTPSAYSAGTMQADLYDRDLERRKIRAEEQIRALIAPYAEDTGDLFMAAARVKSEYEEYLSIMDGDREEKRVREGLQAGIDGLSAEIKAYFERFGVEEDTFERNLARLEKDIWEYDSLLKKAEAEKSAGEERKKKSAENLAVISAFLSRYGFTREKLEQNFESIRADALRVLSARARIEELRCEIEGFWTSRGMTEDFVSEKDPERAMKDVSDEMDSVSGRITTLKNEISAALEECSDLDELRAQKEDMETEAGMRGETEKLLAASADFLSRASAELKADYVQPIQDNFDRYAAIFEFVIGKKIEISPDFRIKVRCGGQELTCEHLSSGERAILVYCFRLALIERMYGDEKPFLILDDPFVSLDEENFEKAVKIVRDISLNFQTLYFTCHPARRI